VAAAAHAYWAAEEASHQAEAEAEDIHSPSPSAAVELPEIPSPQPTQAAVPTTEAAQMTLPQTITPEEVQEPDTPVPRAAVVEQLVAFATVQQLSVHG